MAYTRTELCLVKVGQGQPRRAAQSCAMAAASVSVPSATTGFTAGAHQPLATLLSLSLIWPWRNYLLCSFTDLCSALSHLSPVAT